MHYYFTAISLIAGICLGFGILYLFIGLRRQEDKPLNLTFALFALCYSITLFNGIRWYSATSVTEFIAISRFDSIFSAGAFVGLIWYIAYYTDIRPRIFLWVLSAALIVPSLVYIISPATYTGVVSGLTDIPLPWGEKLIIWDAAGSIWRDTIQLARLVTLGYIIFALIRQFWQGERQPAIILGLGILPFIAGMFYEILGQSGVVPFIPFGEIGFLGIAIAASLQMTNSVIKTEEQLEVHQHELEALVAERTAKLTEANQNLTRENEERAKTENALRQSEERFRKVFEESPLGMALVAPNFCFVQVNQALCQMLDYTPQELTELTFPDITHPDDIDKDVTLAKQLFSGELPFYHIEKRYLTKAGRVVWINLTVALFRDETNQPVFGLAMIENITERHQTEQALNRRVEELAFLHQTSQTINSTTDLPTEVKRVAEMITCLFDARSTRIVITAEDNNELNILAGCVREPIPAEATNFSSHSLTEMPLVQEILNTGESRVISDVQSLAMPRLLHNAVIALDIRSMLLVPLIIRGAAGGLLYISTDQVGRTFTQDEVQLAETLAGDISSAIENARLLEQIKSTATEEERSRIARELHDSVTQTMYSASLVAESLPQVWKNNPAEMQDHLTIILQLIRGALAEMRSLLLELRPETLEKANLVTLLHQLGDALTGQTQVPVQFTVEGPAPDLPPKVKIGLYRMVQGIFHNISKHAHATEVSVNLKNLTNQVILQIQDNGRGFDPAAVTPERMGLQIMRERANDIGASFELKSKPGQGTRISIVYEEQK
jgi:PAS domain S-box-containing protein